MSNPSDSAGSTISADVSPSISSVVNQDPALLLDAAEKLLARLSAYKALGEPLGYRLTIDLAAQYQSVGMALLVTEQELVRLGFGSDYLSGGPSEAWSSDAWVATRTIHRVALELHGPGGEFGKKIGDWIKLGATSLPNLAGFLPQISTAVEMLRSSSELNRAETRSPRSPEESHFEPRRLPEMEKQMLDTPAASSSFSLFYDPAPYLNDEGVREATGAAWSCVTAAESIFASIRSNLPWEIIADQLSRLHREAKDSEYAIETMYEDFAECGLRIQVGGVDEISAHAAALALAKWVLHEVWTAATEPERWLESEFDLTAIGNNYPSIVKHFVNLPPLDTTELKTLLKQEAILAAKARRTKYAMRTAQAPNSLIAKKSGLTHLDLPTIFRCAVELAEATALVAPSEWAHEPVDIEGPASPHFERWMERHKRLSRIEEECGRLKRSLGATGQLGITDISANADERHDEGESAKWPSYDRHFADTAHDRILRLALVKLSTAAIDLSGFATWRKPQWAMRETGVRLLTWGLAQLWEGMSAQERSSVQDRLQRAHKAVGWPGDPATGPASYDGPEEIPLEYQYRIVTNYVACYREYTDDVQKAVNTRVKQEQERFLRRATLGQFVQSAEQTAKALQAMAKGDSDPPEYGDLYTKAFSALACLGRAKEVSPRENWPDDALEQRHLLADAAGLLLVCVGGTPEAKASLKPEDADKALEGFTRATDRLMELAKTEGDETDRQATGKPLPSTKKAKRGSEQGEGRVRDTGPKPRWETWAIGFEGGAKWHLFRQIEGKWRQQRLVKGISKGMQTNLLEKFAEGGGFLGKTEALKLVRPNFSSGEIDKLMGKIKPEISNLRGTIREAIGLQATQADPLPFSETQKGWRAEIQIGYAVQEDGEHLGGERRLRFKSHEELTTEERAER